MRYFNFLIFLFLVTSLFAQQEKLKDKVLKDFRGIKWNSTEEEVKNNIDLYYLQTFKGFGIKAISYKGEIAGLEARIDFTFQNNKLVEGSYSINPENSFKLDYNLLLKYLSKQFGKPDFKVGTSINSDSVWVKVNKYGKCRGPESYWKFKNGFVCLHAAKFKEDITITILYVFNKTIKEYGIKMMPNVKEFIK